MRVVEPAGKPAKCRLGGRRVEVPNQQHILAGRVELGNALAQALEIAVPDGWIEADRDSCEQSDPARERMRVQDDERSNGQTNTSFDADRLDHTGHPFDGDSTQEADAGDARPRLEGPVG